MSHASGAQRSHALWLNSAQPRRVRCGNRLLACQVASSTPGLESEIPGTPAYSKGALSSDCLRRYPRPLRILLARHCAPAMWWLPHLCAALAARRHHDLPGPVGECISPNRKNDFVACRRAHRGRCPSIANIFVVLGISILCVGLALPSVFSLISQI